MLCRIDPAQPDVILIVNTTTSSIDVSWNVTGNVDHYYVGYRYSSENDEDYDWMETDTNDTDFRISDLPVPGSLYDIAIIANSNGLNSSNAEKPEVAISEYSLITLDTWLRCSFCFYAIIFKMIVPSYCILSGQIVLD